MITLLLFKLCTLYGALQESPIKEPLILIEALEHDRPTYIIADLVVPCFPFLQKENGFTRFLAPNSEKDMPIGQLKLGEWVEKKNDNQSTIMSSENMLFQKVAIARGFCSEKPGDKTLCTDVYIPFESFHRIPNTMWNKELSEARQVALLLPCEKTVITTEGKSITLPLPLGARLFLKENKEQNTYELKTIMRDPLLSNPLSKKIALYSLGTFHRNEITFVERKALDRKTIEKYIEIILTTISSPITSTTISPYVFGGGSIGPKKVQNTYNKTPFISTPEGEKALGNVFNRFGCDCSEFVFLIASLFNEFPYTNSSTQKLCAAPLVIEETQRYVLCIMRNHVMIIDTQQDTIYEAAGYRINSAGEQKGPGGIIQAPITKRFEINSFEELATNFFTNSNKATVSLIPWDDTKNPEKISFSLHTFY